MAVRRAWRLLGALFSLSLVVAANPATGRANPPPYTLLSNQVFHVTALGPNADTACDIYYDLYTPTDANAGHQVPAILTTNGFGGSKADQSTEAAFWASHDYEVLSYSGLGFGGSTCDVYADDQSWDGKAAAQLVDWLGSATAHPEVIKDKAGDPRIGTWGGSYGGGFQFALAAASDKIDAMVPEITWNDLTYSLAPNNNNPAFKYDYGATAPGVQKVGWSGVFYGLGNAEVAANPGYSGWTNTDVGSSHTAANPTTGTAPNPACPGYELVICQETTLTTALGYPSPGIIARLQHASAAYALAPFAGDSGHFPPTMLIQGETDTLFDLNDAVANYRLWQAKGAPVKLVFRREGHSGGDGAGEYNYADPSKGYLTQLTLNWWDHYLKKLPVATGPQFEYFKDWVWTGLDQAGSAQTAFGSAASYPAGSPLTLYFSGGNPMTGSGDLVGKVSQVQAGSVTFSNGAPGLSYSDSPVVSQDQQPAATDPTGQYASFSTGPLQSDLDVVGVPTVDVTIADANPTTGLDSALDVVLFGKIYDVDAQGSKTLVHRLVSAVRVADLSKPIHINLPGIVHRYLKGHSLDLVIATTDATYQLSRATHVLTISPSASSPATVVIPVLQNATDAANAIPLAKSTGANTGNLNTSAARPAPPAWPLIIVVVGLLTLVGGLVARSLSRRR